MVASKFQADTAADRVVVAVFDQAVRRTRVGLPMEILIQLNELS